MRMKISVLTLGCKVNKYESDSIIHNLQEKGYDTFDKLEFADVYVINTCAVTQEAEKKSRQMIARCKKFNKHAKILVCGCASQNNSIQFKEKNVDYIGGVAKKIAIANYIDNYKVLNFGDKKEEIATLPLVYEDDMQAKQTRIRAYIKIQDGCNNFCSYCIIPYLRGRSRSRNVESILKEVESLPDDIKEIVLTGINVTDFKIDGQKGLLALLEKLDKFGKRLRLSSMEESLVDENFVKGLKNLKNFCPHFHLSLQSGSGKVLKDMNRKYLPEEFENSINLIRKYFPNAGITTDVIVGFPTEDDKLFKETKEFIEKIKFSALHIFQYSKREGTVASRLKDNLPEVKKERSQILEELDKKLKKDFIKQNSFGKVLVEEKVGEFFVGYTENYIKCYIKSELDLLNKIVKVKIDKPFEDGALAILEK